MTQTLERITHDAQKTATHAIIWLHGLGADGNDFAPIVPLLNLAPHTKILFPHAPIRAVTLNNGYQMRAWYDIKSLTMRDEDSAGIAQSDAQIQAIMAQEMAQGIKADNILLAGFSQGGAMALYTGLRNQCAGILALSCYLLEEESIAPAKDDSLPILQMHGRQDPVVAYALGQHAHQHLAQLGYQTQWQTYDFAHEVSVPQIQDIATWLQQQGF